MSETQQRELYLLSARGPSDFAKRTAGMELVAELVRSKSIDLLFTEQGVGDLATQYCSDHGHPLPRKSEYAGALREMGVAILAASLNKSLAFAYLTDKDNGALREMTARAEAQGLRVETRTRTKH
ncbi:MAG: hypothetical protein AABY16_01320 [Nanoarchaeota archaeon]